MEEENKVEEVKVEEVKELKEENKNLKSKYQRFLIVVDKLRDIFTKIGNATNDALKRMEDIDKKLIGTGEDKSMNNYTYDAKKIDKLLNG